MTDNIFYIPSEILLHIFFFFVVVFFFSENGKPETNQNWNHIKNLLFL